MKTSAVRFLIAVTLFMSVATPAEVWAQSSSSAAGLGVRKSIAIVMFSGLAGAVLGLSTLSFYGEPQEHTDNIWMGLGAGLAVGGVYALNRQVASRPGSENNRPANPAQVARFAQPLLQYQFDF